VSALAFSCLIKGILNEQYIISLSERPTINNYEKIIQSNRQAAQLYIRLTFKTNYLNMNISSHGWKMPMLRKGCDSYCQVNICLFYIDMTFTYIIFISCQRTHSFSYMHLF